MKLNERTLANIAIMICGDKDQKAGKNFMYRSSSRLTGFFADCGLHYVHDGSTRKYWVIDVLKMLNLEPAELPDLPSESLLRVIEGLMDVDYFQDDNLDRADALAELNKALSRDSLVAFLDSSGKCHVRNDGSGVVSSNLPKRPRPLARDETAQRDRLAQFLDEASEDEFTTVVLVPFFQRLGFHRVDALGHREKTLEFGKDLWMKFQLPTGHWLYFCAQIKKVKIDAQGVSEGNVAEVLNQARMAFGHEIFDPDLNKKVLLDHLFIISASVITRAAKSWLASRLDQNQRRQVIFMDRDELLSHAAKIVSDLPIPQHVDTTAKDTTPF
jgi:hypothetical protein